MSDPPVQDSIPFNKPHLSGRELVHIVECFEHNSQTSGNGPYTKKVQQFFEARYGFLKTLLTTSCTDALEMSAILADIQPDDEVILPAYTFVSTANAFVCAALNWCLLIAKLTPPT